MLQVWFPFNGTMENWGLDTSAAIPDTYTPTYIAGVAPGTYGISVDGKTTGTMNFTSMINATNWTMAYYIYMDSTVASVTSSADIIRWTMKVNNEANVVVRDEIATGNKGRHRIYLVKETTVGANTNATIALTGTRSTASDIWVHIVIRKANDYVDYFENGVRVQHIDCSTFESVPSIIVGALQFGQSTYTMGGQLQDFRFYDNLLTDIQIKALAHNAVKATIKKNEMELWMPLRLSNNFESYGTKKITATGTAITYPGTDVNGKTGKNPIFNGSTSVINTDFNWTPTTGWSIAAWVKHTTATPNGTIVRAATGQSPVFDFNGSNGQVRCMYWISDSAQNTLNTGYIPAQNVWHHYVALWDGSKIKFYVDGVLTATKDNCTETPYNGTGTINIGYYNWSEHMFTGQIADVRLYNYAISDETIYNLSLGKVAHFLLNGMQMTSDDKTEYSIIHPDKHGVATKVLTAAVSKIAVSPRYQYSYKCNGSSGYIKIQPANECININDEFSISLWAYAADWTTCWGSASGAAILSAVQTYGYAFRLNGAKTASGVKLCAYHYLNGFKTAGIELTSITPGWHHFTLTVDGYSVAFYLDGVLIQASQALATKTVITQRNTAFIGMESGGSRAASNSQFTGQVSDIEYFAKCLTLADIQKLYAKGHIPIATAS